MGLFGACLRPENKENGLDIITLAKICKPFLYRRDCPNFTGFPLKHADSVGSSRGTTDNDMDKSVSSKTSGSTTNNTSTTSNNNNNTTNNNKNNNSSSSVFTTPTRMKLSREKGDFSGNLFSSYTGTSPRSKEISFTGNKYQFM